VHIRLNTTELSAQLSFRCRCPGAGKWIENDDVSRQSYAQRTSLRHGQLLQLGALLSLDNTCFGQAHSKRHRHH